MTIAVAFVLTLAAGITVSIKVLWVDVVAVTVAWFTDGMTCSEVTFSFSVSRPAIVIADLFLFTLEGVSSESTTNVEGFIAMSCLIDCAHGWLRSFCNTITCSCDLNSWYNHRTRGDCSYIGRSSSSLTFCSTWRREQSTSTAEVYVMVSCCSINWIKGSFITINYISN